MKCHKHYEMDAVSHCLDCGKALCPNCSEKFSFPICEKCNLIRIGNDKNVLVKNSILMFVLFIFGFSQSLETGFFAALVGGYFFAGIPWGWSALNRITPNIFLFMPLIGWVIYFAVKLVLSMFIGMFVTPFKIYKIVTGLRDAKALEEYTKAS